MNSRQNPDNHSSRRDSDRSRRRRRRAHHSGIRVPGWITLILQILASAALLCALIGFDVFSGRQMGGIAYVLAVFAAAALAGQLLGYRRKFLRRAMYIVSLIVVAVCALLIVFVKDSQDFVEEISTDNGERYSAAVIVGAESPYQKIEELPDVRFAYADAPESVYVEECAKEVKSMLGPIHTLHADNVSALADMLYAGKCDAIIIDEVTRAQIVESHPDFEEKTRTIWALNVKHPLTVEGSKMDVTQNAFNIYVCGSDSRESVEEVALSDVNMIITVNPTTHQILMTSIPRDYYVQLATHDGKDKLTHAGIYGMHESLKTVEQFTGLKMDFYVKLSFASLVYLVDAIDGIDIESDRAFTAWTNDEVHIEEGLNHLNGVSALAYARERKAYPEGDIHRARNQAQIIRAIWDKAMSPALIVHYRAMLKALAQGMITNMSDRQIKSLVKLQMRAHADWDIRDIQMTGTESSSDECYSAPGKELYVMEPDEKSVQAALKQIREFMSGEIDISKDQE